MLEWLSYQLRSNITFCTGKLHWFAAYSIVGEKVEKTLEPLLAAPATDGEILLGKVLVAHIPSIIVTYAGTVIFSIMANTVLPSNVFHQPIFPNAPMWTMLGAVIPVVSLLAMETCVIMSSRTGSVIAAYQFGFIFAASFVVVYVLMDAGLVTYNVQNFLIIAGLTLVADACLAFLVRAVFERETILTKWK